MGRIAALASVGIAVVLLLVASASARTVAQTPAQRCTVVIFFTLGATSDQIAAVKTRVSRDAQIKAFRFTSRAEALELLRKKFPQLVDELPTNPLPARISMQLRAGVVQKRLVARYRVLKLRGVERLREVQPSPCL